MQQAGANLGCPAGVWGGSLLAATGGEVALAGGEVLVLGLGAAVAATGVGLIVIGLVGMSAGAVLIWRTCAAQ